LADLGPAEAVQVDVAADAPATDVAADVADAAHRAAHRALALVQAWLAEPRLATARLAFVTHRATGPGDVLDPAAATVWGLVRTAETENPGRFVLIDVDDDPASLQAVPAALATGEPQLAGRAGALLVPRLARTPAGEAPAGSLDPDGTVLVTGGTGTLGAHVARHLITVHGMRHLLLTSRRGPAAAGATELREELTALGAEVTVAA